MTQLFINPSGLGVYTHTLDHVSFEKLVLLPSLETMETTHMKTRWHIDLVNIHFLSKIHKLCPELTPKNEKCIVEHPFLIFWSSLVKENYSNLGYASFFFSFLRNVAL